MPWFKVDDNLAFHHKVLAAGNPAMGLWVRAGSACAQQLTDGFVANHMLAALGTRAQAERLVTVGLWGKVEGGYRFHEWTERQPSKADVEAERAAAADRMRAYRERKRKGRRDPSSQVSDARSPEHTANERGTNGEVRDVFGDPDPTRPDPTPSSYGTSDGAKAPRGKRATQLPDDWKPNDGHRNYAAGQRLDLTVEAEQFADHHRAKGSTMKDWDAAFRTWLRNAVKFGNQRKPERPVTRLPHVSELETPPDGLSDEEYAQWWHERQKRGRA